MPSIATFIVGFTLIHVVLNVHVTRLVWASEFYEQRQKIYQLLLLWCLPMIGVIFVWMFLRPERLTKKANGEDSDDDVAESMFSEKSSVETVGND